MNIPTPLPVWLFCFIATILSAAYNDSKLSQEIQILREEINELKSPKTLLLPLPLSEETLIQEN
jgi:hypothetical protein